MAAYRLRGIVVTLLALALVGPARAATYYVDRQAPNASDGNPGTEQSPWQTIGKAADSLQPGDVLLVKPGVYREQVVVRVSGTEERPITFRALRVEPEDRVVISGADEITGWQRCTEAIAPGNAHHASIFYADIEWTPTQLAEDGFALPLAREPNEGWWVAEGGGTHTLVDRENLALAPEALIGGSIFFWDVDTTSHNTRLITDFDADAHTITLKEEIYRDRVVEPERDRYYLKNKVQFIDRPGEWAVDATRTPHRIFVWPSDGGDAAAHLYEGSRRGRHLFDYARAKHIIIDGFEVRHGQGHGIGSWAPGPESIRIENCVVHHNDGIGLSIRSTPRCIIRRNVALHNYIGIAAGCEGGLVEENEIGWNHMDGLRIGANNVTVRRNYIHDHTLWGHADNFQLFGGIQGMRFERNLLINGGQQMMMEGTSGGQLAGNMIVGCEAYAVIFGHDTCRDYEVIGNTVALSGYGVLNLTGRGYRIHSNVFVSGHGGPLYGFGAGTNVQSDYNLLWRALGATGPPIVYDRNWHGTLETYRQASGQDAHTVYADPRFVNAPAFFQQMEGGRLLEFTKDKVFLRGGTGTYEVGDIVELNFDGVVRRVREVGEDYIVVEPGRDSLPRKAGVVCNWKDNDDLALDLRLREDSPGRTLSPAGDLVGSDIDIRAFRRGDFDGDGRRDLPLVPPEATRE